MAGSGLTGDRPVPTLAGLLATSDVVSLHLPLTPETRGLIGREELALMRPGAILAALRCADHIAALLAGRPEGVPVATA